MPALDYPKIKEEIRESHKNGVSIETITDTVIEKYGFKRDVITPVVRAVIEE